MDDDVTLNMTFTQNIDGVNDAYVYMTKPGGGESTRQVSVLAKDANGDTQGTLILDFDREGRLLGIEILEATSVLPKSLLKYLNKNEQTSKGH